MHDDSTTDTSQIKIPAELMAAAQRMSTPKREQLRVEAFERSWFTRIGELLVGKG